ncbi:ABC transporter ATP-binding protein [Bacillus horti]|uniref:Sn-glycerol 3-phosphate transport system ATP-binding protein n=1 Tax=Caldalkalibacillus horti TaxID=77523 RepID=A0ABT9VYJ5_9BACI|nr:ABC transporter ATP-binding protein [Bacillus horti]MDQ0165902.1 sn-glycerol 3-phosphate transport system ATP-binding protein [Bacillus horti]
MAQIVLRNVYKRYEKEAVVEDLNVTISDGSFTVLVGPSGCGKSTTLRMIAGLEQLTSGEIWIGDRCVNHVPPGKRDVAMVFQNYALYPTMTVKENIEFGLVNRKVPKQERQALIAEISEIVGLSNYLNKKPQTLSGGQRQRVALARAMVKKPQVFILDEPLSNLDAKLRSQMRTELIQLHQRLGTTFVYVTHDQVEAMSMGDEIIIMNQGRVQQADSPLRVYHDPDNVFAAQFIGTPAMNVITVDQLQRANLALQASVHYVGFRPEKLQINPETSLNGLVLQGDILTRETLGAEIIYQVHTEAGKVQVKSFLAPVEHAKQVQLFVAQSDLYFFDQKGQRIRQQEKLERPKIVAGGA